MLRNHGTCPDSGKVLEYSEEEISDPSGGLGRDCEGCYRGHPWGWKGNQIISPDADSVQTGAALWGGKYRLIDIPISNGHRSGPAYPYGVGRKSFIKNAIIDKNAHIGESVRLCNLGGFKDFDGDNYYIRDGIVIIPKNAVIEDGTRI